MHGFVKRRKSGQAIVLVAASVLVLTAILALALDGGGIYLERRQLQNAADSAALAAAENLWTSTPPNYASMHNQALSTLAKNLGISTAGVVPTNTPGGGSPWSISPNYQLTVQASTYDYQVTLQHTHPVVVAPIHGFASTLQLQVQATAQNENLPYAIVLLQSGAVPTYSNLQMTSAGTALNLTGPGGGNPLDRGGIFSNASIDPGSGNIYFSPCSAGPPASTAGPGTSGDLWAVAETAADGGRVNGQTFCNQTAPSSWKVPSSALPDPGYPEPPAPNVTNPTSTILGGNTILCPGQYTNRISATGTYILYPGVYHVAADVDISGTLRTFNSGDSYPVTNPCGAGTTLTSWGSFDQGAILEIQPANSSGSTNCSRNLLSTASGSTLNLSASAKYFNVSIYVEELPTWQSVCSTSPLGSNVVRITGGGTYNIQGTIYGPADNMQINSGGSTSSLNQVIAWTLTLGGGSAINENFVPNHVPYLKGLTH